MYEFSVGHDKTKVDYKVDFIGNDVDITICGGKSHIGSVVLISNNSYTLINVPNHREDEMLKAFISRFRKCDKYTILIKAGFHLDNIRIDEINEIMSNNQKAVQIIYEYLESL